MVVAVEIDPLGVFTRIRSKASGVEQGADDPMEALVEEAFLEKLEKSLWA